MMDTKPIPGQKKSYIQKYNTGETSVFKILAAYSWAKNKDKSFPQVCKLNGGVRRIQDLLPTHTFVREKALQRTVKMKFFEQLDQDEMYYFISNHTHWGHRLKETMQMYKEYRRCTKHCEVPHHESCNRKRTLYTWCKRV